MLKKIEITHELSKGELESRLRNVRLRGFPDIKIYENADIKIRPYSRKRIKDEISTPQPSVYKPMLDNVSMVTDMFAEKGIDIFKLYRGFDYVALNENDEETDWTIIPPVVEVNPFVMDELGFDFSGLIGEELKSVMKEKGYELNPDLRNMPCPHRRRVSLDIPVICDGAHRVEMGIRRGGNQNILLIKGCQSGFPYYAVPQKYSSVHEEPERIEEKLDKIHVLTSPGHKLLYRVFPSGGINSGNLRPRKERVD